MGFGDFKLEKIGEDAVPVCSHCGGGIRIGSSARVSPWVAKHGPTAGKRDASHPVCWSMIYGRPL